MPISNEADWVRLPTDLQPRNVPKRNFEKFLDLRILQDAGGAWSFKTGEEYLNSGKPGIRLTLIARGAEFEQRALERLTHLRSPTEFASLQSLQNGMQSTREQYSLRSEEPPLWHKYLAELPITLDADLEITLREMQSLGGASDSLWLAECDPIFANRLAFMRTLFAQRYTADAVRGEGFNGLLASRELMLNSVAAFYLYFQPPLLLKSPWVAGYVAPRTNATFIRQLHEMDPGRPSVWTDLLDAFKPGYAGSRGSGMRMPILDDIETREALMQWWTQKLSGLLWLITNPTRFIDDSRTYSPSAHFGTVLTLERIFVTAVEIMRLRTKDEVLRKILLFQLLDLLDGQGMGNYEKNLHHGNQHAHWLEMKPELPEPVSRSIAPIVDGAFEALASVEEGFWLPLARTGEGHLLVDRKNGSGQDSISMDRARGQYLRTFRNSHHGFRDIVNDKRDLWYLANHTGALSDQLADLAWWYLIRLLNDPASLISGPRA